MLTVAKAVMVSGALLYGAYNVEPIDSPQTLAPQYSAKFTFSPDHSTPDSFIHQGTASEASLEKAAENFDDFAIQIPSVIGGKIESVLKHGTKAILMQDPATKRSEDKMINSLINGLKNMGDAISTDMVQSARDARG